MEYDLVLLDIEGTITPISFVYDTLFPYAHDHAERFLREHWYESDVQDEVEALRKLNAEDREAGRTELVVPPYGAAGDREMLAALMAYVHELIHADRKVTPLKSLQGKVWRDGYELGQLRGEFYDDALRAFARFDAAGTRIAIFSSGSVEAQQLLFEHSTEGDLTQFVEAWFDTGTGSKRERESYEHIAESLQIDPSRVLFATDVVAEAQAASEAGMQVVVLERLGNPRQPAHRFRVESDFELI